MKRRLLQVLALCSALVSATASAESLADYVTNCKTDLGITTALPALDCNNGLLFAPSGGQRDPTNDYVGYSRINDVVDLTFACRWLGPSPSSPPFTTAASVEMLINSRQTGHTCFFAASNPSVSTTGVSTTIVPPDDPNASNYWMQPADLDSANISAPLDIASRLRCVGCHVAGPYIASPRIAPLLARFGLLNNGHDTVVNMNAPVHYHAVGSSSYSNPSQDPNTDAFQLWDQVFYLNIPDQNLDGTPDVACSSSCHTIGSLSKIDLLSMNGSTLIPSLTSDIAQVVNFDSTPTPKVVQTIMPPVIYSDYRWVNMDTPTNVATGDTGDIETLQRLQTQYPGLAAPCSSPLFLQAHVVGSDVIFDTSGYQDKLHTFNLRDGLTCLSAEQTGSHACLDYQTRYQCPSGSWTPWINSPSTAPNDHEERSLKSIGSTLLAVCGGGTIVPVAIQAKFTIPGTTNVVVIDGPPDRLAEFDKTGLICNNGDQGVGQSCSNYGVRFICPQSTGTSTLTTEHIDHVGQQTFLTASTATVNQGVNNQDFTTGRQAQQWVMEPVTDFSNSLLWTISVADRARAVRLRNVWTGYYATTNDANQGPNANSPYFLLLQQAAQQTWTTQIWIKEPVPAPRQGFVRLRSAWVPPASKSATTQLYMTLTTAKAMDSGTQDVFIKPIANNSDGSPLDLQIWSLRGVNGSF